MLIFLVGYMGAGKSSLGALLATKLNYRFIDTDSWIENRCCKTVSTIFNESGEDYFRSKEKECMEFLIDKDDVVVATGGGLPCSNDLMNLMNELGEVVYLKADASVLSTRLFRERMHRPILSNIHSQNELNLFITKHLPKRDTYYAASKLIINTEKKNQMDLVKEIQLLIFS